jgi:hypothetical protein
MADNDSAPREPGPQPDPLLRSGKLEPLWLWMTAIVVIGVVVATLFAVGTPTSTRDSAANVPSPPPTSGPSTSPSPAHPTGRQTTGAGTGGTSGKQAVPQGGERKQ